MKAQLRLAVVLTMLFFLAYGHATGRTWRVEKDGSGDFTTIQPALDATAPGDTVLIGPGRFIETHEVTTPGWTEDIYAAVWSDSISIFGSGVGVTYIGPEVRNKQLAPRPKGILGAYDIDGCRIEDLTIENIRDGMYWDGGIEIDSCSINGCVEAVLLDPGGMTVSVNNVLFQDNTDHGIFAWGPCPELLVSDCTFNRNGGGVSVIGVDSMLVDNCTFEDHVVSVKFDATQGEIRNCRFVGGVNVDVASYGSHLLLNNCRLSSPYRAIVAGTWGYLRGSGNVIPPGEGERILISNTLFYFNDNHILRSEAPYIKLVAFVSPPADTLDFTGNYWGTTEVDTIAEWIWDGRDDPDIYGIVEFEPFSPVPVSTEKKSMGDIKRMFR